MVVTWYGENGYGMVKRVDSGKTVTSTTLRLELYLFDPLLPRHRFSELARFGAFRQTFCRSIFTFSAAASRINFKARLCISTTLKFYMTAGTFQLT